MEHCWHIIATSVFVIVGVVIVISSLNAGARHNGMFLVVAGPFAGVTYVSTLHLGDLYADYRPEYMPLDRQRTCLDRGRNVAPSLPICHHELCCHCFALVQPYFFVSLTTTASLTPTY
jgi:hypothetical protein